jgi:transposase-like protein
MKDEFTARQRAITLRLSGRSVKDICSALGRSEFWFHKWWRRYSESGAEGLYDLTRANHQVAQRISPELERTILSIRRRLQAHATPGTRYSLIGADAILAELKALSVRPLPSRRTIERVLQRNGLTAPRVRLAPLLPRQQYPGPQARASNQLHEVDLVGPIYLKGSGHRYYIWVCKDAFDGAAYLRLASSRRMSENPSSTAAWRTSTAGSRSRSCSGGSTARGTCVGSWRGCKRRSTPSMSTRGWGARRRRSTAAACGCRSCPRASWCRRGGWRWPRGA